MTAVGTMIVLLLLVAGIVVGIAVGYNALVRRRNAVQNAWAQIDVQLRRRHDLVPRLVTTVRGYATHEQRVFEAVATARATARAAATGAAPPSARAAAEGALDRGLQQLLMLAESYPALQAGSQFLALQQELASTENRIAYSRQYYNDAVLHLANAIQTLPLNLIAAAVAVRPAEYFRC